MHKISQKRLSRKVHIKLISAHFPTTRLYAPSAIILYHPLTSADMHPDPDEQENNLSTAIEMFFFFIFIRLTM